VGQEIPRPLYLIRERLRGPRNTVSFRGETASFFFFFFFFW
jgi:hypothetical protein